MRKFWAISSKNDHSDQVASQEKKEGKSRGPESQRAFRQSNSLLENSRDFFCCCKKNQKKYIMASDQMWGGLPFIVPSGTAMKYLYHAKVINEEDVPVGAHYRAREDMLNNVRFKF